MGAADRGRVAIFARQISFAGDLLATVEAVVSARRMARRLAGLVGFARRQGLDELGRDVPGRQLRFRQKGGSAVGKTKRDKGTKWMY